MLNRILKNRSCLTKYLNTGNVKQSTCNVKQNAKIQVMLNRILKYRSCKTEYLNIGDVKQNT